MARYPGYAIVRRLSSRRRQIFEAIEQRDPWRRVALALGGEAELAAIREAAGRLDHPGIAQLVADHGDAVAFAWRTGRRLDRVEALAPADRLELAIQIAELVAHAHARGVVLRDLKPGNLLVDRGDGWLHVALVDLDLARVEGAAAVGTATGTWGWSAPEQAALDPRAIDRRADLYALGTTLAFVLSGAPLFGTGAGAVRAQLIEDPLAACDLPEAQRAIVRQLVVVERAARRPAAEVVAALRQLRGPLVRVEAADASSAPGSRAPASAVGASPSTPADDDAYAAFRAAVAAIPAAAAGDPLAVARISLRLGDREAARRHAQALPADDPGALAILARVELEAGDRAAALALLDRIAALPAAPEAARDVLATELTALRPARAQQLAGDAAVLRERAAAWLAELDALRWHERLAWSLAQPDGDAAAHAIAALAGAELHADSVASAAAQIDALFARGAIAEAAAELRHWFARAPESPELWAIARRAAAAGNVPALEDLAARAVLALERAGPRDALADAIAASMTAVMRAPRSRSAWLRLAEQLIGAGRLADAHELLASFERVFGADPVSDRLRAHAWLALDEADLAVAAGLRALQGGSEQPALWQTLALAWIRASNPRDARNAIAMLVRHGDPAGRAPRLAFYAALVDADSDRRLELAAGAAAAHPDDADLVVLRALAQLAAGAPAPPTLAQLAAARPAVALSLSAKLALRGTPAAVRDALDRALLASHDAAVAWAATHHYLAIAQPLTATMFIRDHADAFPELAAEAFLEAGDGDALRALAPGVPALADTLAARLR